MRITWPFILLIVSLSPPRLPAQAPPHIAPGSLSQLQVPQPPVDVSSPATATASFDPPIVRAGEKTFYRVTIDAEEASIQWPKNVPAPPELKFGATAHGHVTENLGNRFRPLTTFLCEVRPAAAGQFTVPDFTVEVNGHPIHIPVATVNVNNSVAGPPARELVLEIAKTNAYPGEPIDARVLLPASPGNEVEALHEIQFNGRGLMVDKTTAHQSVQMTTLNGRSIAAYIFETRLTPIMPGTLDVSVQAFTAGRQFIGPITISGQVVLRGGAPEYTLLVSDPVQINVRPLPAGGRLPGFTGAIGKFTLDPPKLATTRLHVGQPVQLSTAIHGEGDLSRVAPPPPPQSKDWEIFSDPSAAFSYTLIPLTDNVKETPAIPFSSFNPETGRYADLTIPSVPVTVSEAGLPTELPSMDAAFASGPPLKLSSLSPAPGNAAGLEPLQLRGWFVCLELVPVLGLLGLWRWDRHRRFLEAHPDIVRRRRARRALRREKSLLQQAAARRDLTAFVRHAADAMKIACAPHYPAHPQALVCADVLEQLGNKEKNSGADETVRKIFASADARFAAAPQKQADWPALQSDVDAVLERLEEKL